MQLVSLSIDKIIIHQVFQRDTEGKIVTPDQSHEFTRFDDNAMNDFKVRVRDALGENSKAVQMQIVHQGKDDLPVLVDNIIEQNDIDFAVSSYDFATKLAKAQHSKGMPGGIVVVFSGTQGKPAKKFLGIIKAEVHSGYEKLVDSKTGKISLKYIEELLLTPGTRLYKTAAFFQKEGYDKSKADLNENWVALVSDYQISKTDGKAAALYFYSDFLGLDYPETSARTTKLFFESASSFIEALDVPAEIKSDYHNALTAYMKVGVSSTVSSEEFASTYFDLDLQDEFKDYMEEAGLPTTAFTKDTEHIESKLKFRRVNFSKNVKITAPADVFQNLITIEAIEGEPDETGTPTEWTKVIIRDRITQQE
jgi:hypothetical protein